MITTSDVMSPNPLVVHGDDTATLCRERMERFGVRHLALVDESGRLTGVITDFALVRAAPDAPAVRSAVPVQSVLADDSLQKALITLRSTTQDALFVVDEDDRPVGVISEHDIVRFAPTLFDEVVLAVRRPMRPLLSADPDDTWELAFQMMIDHGIRHVPVIAGDRITRIVSMRDLIGLGAGVGADHTLGALFPETKVEVAIEGSPVAEIAGKMADHGIGCLPLLDFAHRPVGIVTRADIVELCLAAIAGAPSLSEVWEGSVDMDVP